MTETVVQDQSAVGDGSPSQDRGDLNVFELGGVVLQGGITLPDAKLAYKTYGQLNTARDNAILMPTFFGGQHADTELMLSPGRALDPSTFFVIVPDLFGDGLSSSPSNTPSPFDGPCFPHTTLYDNVTCQHRLVTEHFGIDRLRLVVGFSMGAQQALQWGALYPDMVDAIAPICGSAKTSTQNRILLQGVKAALTTAVDFQGGWYRTAPAKALRAFVAVYCSLVACSEFYTDEEYTKLGLASPEDVMRFFEGFFRQRDANDLLAKLQTWQHADISANDIYKGNLEDALAAMPRAIVMPSRADLLFPVVDSHREAKLMPDAELRPIPSTWGHLAGFGANPADNEFIDAALDELLRG
ncbi:MAG: alpha/beta fold hydrolase [Actinomycetota bacterium]|nr:alpha/beta fold hydrolase [Actinomycetota bacterium]